METAHNVLISCAGICSVSVLISHIELLSLRQVFTKGSWFSPEVVYLTSRWRVGHVAAPLVAFVLDARVASFLLLLSILAALWTLIGALQHQLIPFAALLMAAVIFIQAVRMPVGLEGSDQMQLCVFGPISLLCLDRDSRALEEAVTYFISGQACLAYFTAGAAKAISPSWRSGEAMKGVMATEIYGSPKLLSMLQAVPGSSFAIAWAVIAFEVAFPFAIVASPSSAALFIAIGAAFHISIAFCMGLNCFVWSFLATYPALLWTAERTNIVQRICEAYFD